MIRPSTSEDVPRISSLVQSILAREFPQDQAAYPADDLEQLPENYSGVGEIFLVAEQDKRIVGTCGVKAESAKTAILRRFFVDPDCRGKGIGSELLQEALSFCRKQGFREVVIRTSTRMEQAIRLCSSSGFQEDGRWMLGDVTLVRFHLRLAR